MGERSRDALRLDFDRKLKVEFHGTKVTSELTDYKAPALLDTLAAAYAADGNFD